MPTHAIRSMVPTEHCHVEPLTPGVSLRRLYPGGMAGPNGETRNDIPGGQTWSEIVMLGNEQDDFIYGMPDIRMPPNQIWPMHWHDCWTVVVILEGKCQIGDWYMMQGDVFVAAPSIEYGPLLIGPMGCRLLEIFADLALAPGATGRNIMTTPRSGAVIMSSNRAGASTPATKAIPRCRSTAPTACGSRGWRPAGRGIWAIQTIRTAAWSGIRG